MYSIVIPFLSDNKTTSMCLDYLKKNSMYEHELVLIENERDVYYAYNKGVYTSKYEKVVLMNDDMIVAKDWDKFIPECQPDTIYTGYVVEKQPGKMINGPTCIECDCGDFEDFDYEKFQNFTNVHGSHVPDIKSDSLGWYMPVVVNQRTFVSYPNINKFPEPNDVMLFHHILPFAGFKSVQMKSYFYHFSGVARKRLYK